MKTERLNEQKSSQRSCYKEKNIFQKEIGAEGSFDLSLRTEP